MKSIPAPAIEKGLNLNGSGRSHTQFKQQGAVLAVSMLLLFAMTLIGITALNSTKLEQNMAGNYQSTVRAFELAESAILTGMQNPREVTDEDSSEANLGDYHGKYDMNIRYTHTAPAPVEDNPSSLSNFVQVHWEITGTGTITSPDGAETIAEEVVRQGIHMLAPGSNN